MTAAAHSVNLSQALLTAGAATTLATFIGALLYKIFAPTFRSSFDRRVTNVVTEVTMSLVRQIVRKETKKMRRDINMLKREQDRVKTEKRADEKMNRMMAERDK